MLEAYVEENGHWPTDDAWRRMTLPEAKAAHEARMRRRGGKIIEGAPVSEEDFIPGQALPELHLPEEIPGRFLDPSPDLPEPLLRRVWKGPAKE